MLSYFNRRYEDSLARRSRAAQRLCSRPCPPPGEREPDPEEDRHADAENQMKADRDPHHRGMEAAANAQTLQRQHDEPEHGQRGEAEDEPAQPPSETSCQPALDQGVRHPPEPGPEPQRKGLRHTEG